MEVPLTCSLQVGEKKKAFFSDVFSPVLRIGKLQMENLCVHMCGERWLSSEVCRAVITASEAGHLEH